MRKFFLAPSLVLCSCMSNFATANNVPSEQGFQISPFMQLAQYSGTPILNQITVQPVIPNEKMRRKSAVAKKVTLPKVIAVNQPLSYQVINEYFKKGENEYAKKLALAYLAKEPNDGDVHLVLGQIYMKEKNYEQARSEFEWILAHYPKYVDARVSLAELELAEDRTSFALQLINEGLKLDPNDPYLLNEKAQIYLSRYQYAIAAAIAKQAIAKNPSNADAIETVQETLSAIKEVSPRYTYGLNEIGFSTQNDYVSDVSGFWDYSNLYYARDTPIGRVAATVNYANRFGQGATQGELDFSPIITKNIYFEFVGAYAQHPALFPDYLYGGVGHFSIPGAVDLAGGGQYWSISDTFFTMLTGAVSKYVQNYWFNFQPYYYVPKHGSNSMLYTATARRYFSTDDESISLTLGKGHSPDLADLQTVNFLKIRNEFAAVNVEFPIFKHRFVVDLGADYQHWQYPGGLVRDLSGGVAGIKYRF